MVVIQRLVKRMESMWGRKTKEMVLSSIPSRRGCSAPLAYLLPKKINENNKINIMNQKAIMKERCVTYDTASDQETIHLGQKLGEALKRGDIIALVGELGSGKTWFTKGLALGSGVSPDTIVTSPSFALINEYEGRYTFFHMDVYRLETLSDFLAAGLDEYFYQDGVVAMEWADRWPEVLPEWRVKVEFVILNSSSRRVILSGYDPRAIEIIKTVEQELN